LAKRISLALIAHNHQPVGNFGWVVEDVYEKAYEPMIAALERHPKVRLALHYTGPLLDWMANERPASIERLRALVERDQVEILGGGLYEPILVSLPQRDRAGQLTRMRDEVAARFGAFPRGAWLAERVWEPSLPFDLASAGYEYTVLDDNHLRGAFAPEDRMWGTFTTDDQGKLLTIFGTERGLRYRIPWKPVPDLIDYLRDNATEQGDRVGIMGDDGEKFGAWPGTYELCWSKEMWVDECFEALEENESWLTTVTPSSWMDAHAAQGRIYIPTSSYVEMTEWALPAREQPLFHELIDEATESESSSSEPEPQSASESASAPPTPEVPAPPAPEARFLRGALWRNFQARYREINDLHKQMLRTSAEVEAMPPGDARDEALDHLYRGQSNDCYWHGWFGGIYIVHMRMATFAELIAAEDLALGDDGVLAGTADYDLDGVDEVALGTTGQTVVVDVAEGAGIGSWDAREARVALAAVLRRRPEPYHEQIREAARSRPMEELADPGVEADPPDEVDAEDLSKLLVYDDHERRSALARVVERGRSAIGAFDTDAWNIERTSDSELVATRTAEGITLRKTIALTGDRSTGAIAVSIEATSESNLAGTLELEWNLNLLGGGTNPDAYYRSGEHEWRHDEPGSVEAGAGLSFGNSYVGVDISVEATTPAPAEWYPIDTVSNSEQGFERVYQGSCLIQRWPLNLAAGQSATLATTFRLTQSRDRSAPEANESEAAEATNVAEAPETEPQAA